MVAHLAIGGAVIVLLVWFRLCRLRYDRSFINKLWRALRSLPLPVSGRVADDRLLLDLRCLENASLFAEQLPLLADHLK